MPADAASNQEISTQRYTVTTPWGNRCPESAASWRELEPTDSQAGGAANVFVVVLWKKEGS